MNRIMIQRVLVFPVDLEEDFIYLTLSTLDNAMLKFEIYSTFILADNPKCLLPS